MALPAAIHSHGAVQTGAAVVIVTSFGYVTATVWMAADAAPAVLQMTVIIPRIARILIY
jgi:hypothetical protein